MNVRGTNRDYLNFYDNKLTLIAIRISSICNYIKYRGRVKVHVCICVHIFKDLNITGNLAIHNKSIGRL